ncbi:hypothetical protein ACHAXT_007855 [Thalassiosira profunda]
MASSLRHAATRHALVVARPRRTHRAPISPRLPLQQTRTKRTAAKKDRRAAASRAIAENEASSVPVNDKGEPTLIFGMRPVDYSTKPPIRNPPPPPPPKPGMQKFLFPLTLLITAGTVGYFYVNNQNDNYEYWRAMQSGEALRMDEEYEDDEDEDEEEEEEETVADASKEGNRRGWFGWLRRRKQGEDGSKPETSR